MKRYILIAGVNGAGKSTLYHALPNVGITSPELAKGRVKLRVSRGGHGIPEKDIENRYIETFRNLKIVLPYCDLAAFYDNTEAFRRFAIYKNGFPVRLSHETPEWFNRFVLN